MKLWRGTRRKGKNTHPNKNSLVLWANHRYNKGRNRKGMKNMTNEEKILEMLSAMQSSITTMQTDITTMQADITTIKQDVKALDRKVEEGFKSTRSELVDAVETVGRKVERLEGTIKAVEDVTAQNAYDVQLMKRRA